MMRPVLIGSNDIWEEHGEELVVTGGLEGTHSAGSLHYYGRALDLRTRYFSDQTKREVTRKLREFLGEDYDVVLESSHCHIEWQVK